MTAFSSASATKPNEIEAMAEVKYGSRMSLLLFLETKHVLLLWVCLKRHACVSAYDSRRMPISVYFLVNRTNQIGVHFQT
jgi:hypothetical protein